MAMARPHSAFIATFRDDDYFGGGSFNDTASTDRYKSDLRPQHPLRFLSLPPPLQHPPSTPRPQPCPPSYLTLLNTDHHQFSYSLKQLGIPHSLTPATQTPSFWHQFDLVDHFSSPSRQQPAFGYTAYNYLSDPFIANMSQDFVPVFIGSNTANGKIIRSDDPSKQRKYRGNDLLKPFGYIVLSIEGETVDEIRLQDLIRFSKTLAAAFSKNLEERAESEAKLGFEVKVLRTLPGSSRTVNLVNSHGQIWTTAPTWAFAEVLNWMHAVRPLPRSADLPQLTPVGMEDYTLHDLIALYAASMTLDIRPRAVTSDLRARIIRTLAYLPSRARDWQFVHERLPIEDVVLRKMVETFFVHGERNHYRQRELGGEVRRIQGYVNGCGHKEFKDLVVGIMESRSEGRIAAEGMQRPQAQGKGKGKGKTEGVQGKAVGNGEAGGMKVEQVQSKVEGGVEDETAELESTTPQDSVVGSPAGKVAKV